MELKFIDSNGIEETIATNDDLPILKAIVSKRYTGE